MIAAVFQVVVFEFQRSLTLGRIAAWSILWIFPIGLMMTARFFAPQSPPIEVASLVAYFLVPQATCMLGLLLWATPAIQTEMEGRTWIYLTMRPRGKIAAILGKYVLAVLWSCSAGWISATVIPFIMLGPGGQKLALVLYVLVALSCVAYGALYLLIGIAMTKWTIVVAVSYSLIIELVISMVPATFNQLTISYRLRSLLVQWLDLGSLDLRKSLTFSQDSALVNIAVLLGSTLVFLAASILLVRRREYSLQGDV